MYRKALKHVIFVSLVTTICIPVDVDALKCVLESSCHCHLPDKSFYDLTEVSPTSPLKGAQHNYTFSFMPCKDEIMNLGNSTSTPGACNKKPGVSLCAQTQNDLPFSLGDTSETKWELTEDGSAVLVLAHDDKTARISLFCCNDCPGSSISMLASPLANKFHFALMSPHACRTMPEARGLSFGSIMLILLFVFSGIYLLVGALALKFFRGAVGWELIPNYDFWSELPGLVRDGIAYTFSGCTAYTYSQI